MVMINWHLYIYLSFIILNYQSSNVYSIQCCRDSACLENPIECPSNVCFKFVFGKTGEYRGCMGDLSLLINPNLPDKNINDDNTPSNDACQDVPGGGASLCKCTSNLCNSSSKYSYFSFPVLIFIAFVVYQFPCVFLS